MIEWREIEGLPGYFVSNTGQIRGPRGIRVLSGHPYLTFDVRRCGQYRRYTVHRIVCRAWHGPPPADKPLALHGPLGSKTNTPENLRWGDFKDNWRDYADSSEYRPITKGQTHHKAKLSDEAIAAIKAARGVITQRVLAETYGCHQSHIKDIQLGRRRS